MSEVYSTEKKIKALIHLRGLSYNDSNTLLETFNGDIGKALKYEISHEFEKNPTFKETLKIDADKMIETWSPYVAAIKENYSNEEISTMYNKLKEHNKVAELKFLNGLANSYMDKLD